MIDVEIDWTVSEWTQEQTLRLIVNRSGTRLVANRHIVFIAAHQERLVQEIRHPMRQNTVALHLTDTETSVVRSTLHWLPSEHRVRTPSAVVDLVLHHMFQSHIISGANEDIRLHLFSRHPIVHDLIACGIESRLHEKRGICLIIRTLRLECRAVAECAIVCAQNAQQTLHNLSDRHTRRKCVWINNQIGSDSIGGEWHIIFGNYETECALLSSTRRHLVADSGNPLLAHSHLCNVGPLFTLCHERFVDEP